MPIGRWVAGRARPSSPKGDHRALEKTMRALSEADSTVRGQHDSGSQ